MIRSSRGSGRRAGSLVAVLALVAGLLTITSTVTSAPTANAATVNLGTIQAQMAEHRGQDSGQTGNCIRYSPSSGSPSVSPSAWVTNPTAAITAHGYSGSCPTNLDINTQSAVAFVPSSVSSVNDGTAFLIGRMTHYNNPVSTSDQYFTGKLNTQLTGFGNATITFNWNLDETPNQGPSGCCDDVIEFTNQVADVTLTQGGLTFKLVMLGFVKSTTGSCPDTPAGSVQNRFETVERAQTNACLYAQLSQIRQLKVVKTVAGSPPGSPTFPFTTTSKLDGTPWSNRAFTLANGGSVQDLLTSGNTVTITETNPNDDRWALTGLTCKQWDATGAVLVDVPGATLNLAARQAVLTNVPAPLYVNDPLITCTFTNTYTPKTTLTLEKTVQGGVVSPTLWTLTATGNAAPTTGVVISGASGSAGVTNQRIVAGNYQLTERGTGAAETGFVQVGNWSCAYGNPATTVPVTPTGVVTLPDLPTGTTVTCGVVNRQATGSLQILKQIDDPSSGYIGGSGKTFSGTYHCGANYTGSFSTLTTATAVTISGIPAGRTCTVAETAPSGGLLNASFAWGTPTYSTQPVTITDQGTAPVTITNHVVQKSGTFAVTKVITGPGGYTGGTTRIFPVTYTCTLTNGPTTSGTLNVTTAQAVSPADPIPMGSVCTLGETLTAQPGDFGDPSYAWVQPPTIAPAPITIGDNTTTAVTVTNTYTRDTGSLVIAKIVQGDGYVGTGEPFVVHYDCGVASGTVNLAPGGSKTIEDLPARNTCAVQEDPPGNDLLDAGHEWGTPTWSPGATAAVPANGSVTLIVTNPTVPVYGRVQVTKVISGETDGVTGAARFDIAVNCDNGYANTFTLTVAGSGITPNLPVGTTCTITETPPTGGLVDGSYAWSPDVQISPSNEVTIQQPDQLITITVTNTVVRVRGSLEITKALVDPDGVVEAGRQFSVDFRCVHGSDDPVTGSVEVGAGGTATVDDLLLGSSCTVIEDPGTLSDPPSAADQSYVWLPVTYTPGNTVTVASATDPAQVTVTNRVDRLLGTFQLSKAVIGEGKDGGYDTDVRFIFTVVCSNGLDEPVELADGQSWTPTDPVPVDTECTITESLDRPGTEPEFGWDPVQWSVDRAPRDGSSVTFEITEANVPVQVNAINPITPRFGSVTLTKQVTGETAGLVPGASFAVTLNCGAGQSYRIPLVDRGSFTQDGIRAGSTCTAVEAPPSQDQLVDASFAWGAPTYDPDDATVTVAVDTTRTIAVSNPIERVNAPVRLVKTLSGPQGVVPADRTYPVTWSCTYGGGSVGGGTVNVTTDPAGVLLTEQVPLTSQCTATESTPTPSPSADPAFRWLTPTVTGVTVTAAGPNTITVANSFTRDNGQVIVHKEVTGATAGYIGTGAAFTMHGRCMVPGHPEIPTRYADGDIANGGSVTIEPVSVGWTCSGYEDTPSQSLLRDTSYAWAPAIITGDPALTPPVGGTFTLPSAGAIQNFKVENPIVRVSSTFKITKNVVDKFGVVPDNTLFTGTYSCVYGTDNAVTGTWSVTSGQTFTGPPVFLNSVCTVNEDSLGTTGLPDNSYEWGPAAISGTATVVPGGSATVTVTNTVHRLYGGLQVTKTLVDPDGGAPAGIKFGGVWTCTQGDQTYSDRFAVDTTGPATLFSPADERVPATAACSIIEDTPDPSALLDGSFGWAPPTYDPVEVTLVNGETATLGITDTVIRVYSGIFIAKDVTGPADGLVRPDRPFTGMVSCQYRDEAPVEATWSATQATPWVSGNYLVGSVCRVTSEDPPGATGQPVDGDPSYIWGDPTLGVAVTVPPPNPDPEVEERPTITVTNPTERLFGRFYLTKEVTEATAGIVDPEPFPIAYSCQPGVGGPITGTADIDAGETLTVGPDSDDDIQLELPVGSVCTLTEPMDEMPALRDSAWNWGEPGFTVEGDIPTAGPVTQTCVAPPPGDPQVTPCLGFPARSVTVTIPRPQEDFPDPPNIGLKITNPVIKTDGAYTVSKTSDPASGSVVLPGQTISYSVTVNSTGDVPVHGVVVTDDLSTVLPSATLGTITAPDGTSAALTGTSLVWTVGDVPNGETRTLTYEATVNPGAVVATIKNLVTATGDVPPGECDPCTTTHTTPLPPTITKTPDGQPVFDTAAGTWTVPYSISVTNPNPDTTVPYTLTDNITFPTDVPIVSASVTSAPDGVTLFDPPWNGSDQTTVAADVELAGGATHTYRVAVVATVPLTLGSADLECAATGSGGGSGFFNLAAVSSMGTSSSADACDPIPVMLVVDKQWVIDGVAYANGDQPAGYSATPTIGGVEAVWGTVYVGFVPGTVVDVQENATAPEGCATSATGTGEVTLTAPLTSVTVTNIVDCEGPSPTTTPTTPVPTTTLTTLTTAYPPGPGPTPPLPNTGFSTEPFVFWGLGLLLAGALLVFGAWRRWYRPRG